MNDFAAMNAVYARYFEEASAPARACVQVSLLTQGCVGGNWLYWQTGVDYFKQSSYTQVGKPVVFIGGETGCSVSSWLSLPVAYLQIKQ